MPISIMLVEDERWVRTALRKVIGKVNLPLNIVHEATNGLDASDWLQSNKADLVLTDIRMPVMDGLSLLMEIKRRRYSADVMIVSGHDDFDYAQQGIRGGAVDYLLKPIEARELEIRIRMWMGSKKQAIPGGRDAAEEELSPVEQVIRQIESERLYHITSAEAAEMAHLNASYFSKLFKNMKSVTFTEYMCMFRIREAARLLEQTSLRVCEIAERLGFSDTAYFSNCFRREIGQPPSDYRKEMQGRRGSDYAGNHACE